VQLPPHVANVCYKLTWDMQTNMVQRIKHFKGLWCCWRRTCKRFRCWSKPSRPQELVIACAAHTASPEGPNVALVMHARTTSSSPLGPATQPRRRPGAMHLDSVSTRATRPSVSRCMKPGSKLKPETWPNLQAAAWLLRRAHSTPDALQSTPNSLRVRFVAGTSADSRVYAVAPTQSLSRSGYRKYPYASSSIIKMSC
jgi:hypothetical protein